MKNQHDLEPIDSIVFFFFLKTWHGGCIYIGATLHTSTQETNMKTIGNMTTSTLESLLASFPRSAAITRHETVITVCAPNGQKVLSAISPVHGMWNVMSVPGLVDKK